MKANGEQLSLQMQRLMMGTFVNPLLIHGTSNTSPVEPYLLSTIKNDHLPWSAKRLKAAIVKYEHL